MSDLLEVPDYKLLYSVFQIWENSRTDFPVFQKVWTSTWARFRFWHTFNTWLYNVRWRKEAKCFPFSNTPKLPCFASTVVFRAWNPYISSPPCFAAPITEIFFLYNFGSSPAAKSPFSCSISLVIALSLLRWQILGSTLVVVSFILRYGYVVISLLAYSNSSWYHRKMPIVRGRTRITD